MPNEVHARQRLCRAWSCVTIIFTHSRLMTYAFSRTRMPAWYALVTCSLSSQIEEQHELALVQDKSACCAQRTRLSSTQGMY